jgi:hypothetical protein
LQSAEKVSTHTYVEEFLVCKLSEDPKAVVMVHNEPHNSLLALNDAVEVLQFAYVLKNLDPKSAQHTSPL